MGRTKITPELEDRIVNRLKFGMKKTEVCRELNVGERTVDRIYKEHGFDRIPVEKTFPAELLKEWDELHRRYGTCQK